MRRLYRERFDKRVAGVCGGLGQYLKVDATIIRLVVLILSIFSAGIFILFYLLMWLVLPLGPKAYVEAKYKHLYRSRRDRRLAGICGGLGKYFRVDSNVLRIVMIVLFFITGIAPLAIAYLIGIAVIPEEPPGHR